MRTKNGEIHKVIEIKENRYITNFADYFYYRYDNNMGGFKSNIANHSKQLIDLIEVGDIVNGREVKHIAMFEGFPDYPKLIFVDETHLIPDDTCENDEIKTILTKEIYMANCYKVGGEDE